MLGRAKRIWISDVLIVSMVVLGFVAIVHGVRGETLHQLIVCRPGEDCVKRGEPHEQSTSCLLDAASERLTGNTPTGTRVRCEAVKK